MRTDASPGEGAETASPTTLSATCARTTSTRNLDESHPRSTLFWFHVKPAITSIRYEFPYVHSSAVRGRHTEVSMAPRS